MGQGLLHSQMVMMSMALVCSVNSLYITVKTCSLSEGSCLPEINFHITVFRAVVM